MPCVMNHVRMMVVSSVGEVSDGTSLPESGGQARTFAGRFFGMCERLGRACAWTAVTSHCHVSFLAKAVTTWNKARDKRLATWT